jgi:hypothetical protein
MKTSIPSILLRSEGLALFALGCWTFHALDGSWGWFAALFLVPDLAMLGYLAGRSVGAHAYNTAHTLLVPVVLAALAMSMHNVELGRIAALWAAHIGFDRVLGYGLKYTTRFKDTHLSRV